MRLFSFLIIFVFAFGLVEMPLMAEAEPVPSNGCCCSSSETCNCGQSMGASCMMHSSGAADSHSVSEPSNISLAFEALGCGTNPGI